MNLTEKDDHLIALLRANARLSVAEIARRLAVSRTAAQARLQKLERNGVIQGYTVKLAPEAVENRVRALVMIRFPPGKRAPIQLALAALPNLVSLYSISGTYDLAAVISAPTMARLDTVIDTIGCLEGIDETMSSIILSTKIDR